MPTVMVTAPACGMQNSPFVS